MFIAASSEGKVKEIGEKVSRHFDANEHHLFCRSLGFASFSVNTKVWNLIDRWHCIKVSKINSP